MSANQKVILGSHVDGAFKLYKKFKEKAKDATGEKKEQIRKVGAEQSLKRLDEEKGKIANGTDQKVYDITKKILTNIKNG